MYIRLAVLQGCISRTTGHMVQSIMVAAADLLKITAVHHYQFPVTKMSPKIIVTRYLVLGILYQL